MVYIPPYTRIFTDVYHYRQNTSYMSYDTFLRCWVAKKEPLFIIFSVYHTNIYVI